MIRSVGFFCWCLMKQLLAIFLALLLVPQASAQIKTSTTEKLALLGVTSPVVQGNRILVGADSNVAVSPVVIVEIETDYKFRRVKARRDGQRIEPEALSETQYLFAGRGKYLVEITVFDPEKGIDDTELAFEIGGKPEPDKPDQPDKPDVPPEPPAGPFDNLALRVSVAARLLSDADKAKYAATIGTVVQKMKAYQFRTVDQVRDYVRSAKLPSYEMNKLLEDDARTRLLSFNETIQWYEEAQKGIKQ